MQHMCSFDHGMATLWFSLGAGCGLLGAYFALKPPT